MSFRKQTLLCFEIYIICFVVFLATLGSFLVFDDDRFPVDSHSWKYILKLQN